jgi:hypothetical protein
MTQGPSSLGPWSSPGTSRAPGGCALIPFSITKEERHLVLDQSMIMAALDNALKNREMQRPFAADNSVSGAAQLYLSVRTLSI